MTKTAGVVPVLSNVDTVLILRCLKDLGIRTSTSTADTRRRGLVQFFRWLVQEKNMSSGDNPMSGVKPRKVVERVIPPLSEEIINDLLEDTNDRKERPVYFPE
ncbi:MAG: hypothetical protein ACR2KQ_06290 [Actinomycetota bacterium]